ALRANSLYARIGHETLQAVVTEFYARAFRDGIIGHLFFGRDRAELTRQQIDFVTALLGGPRNYRGRALESIHKPLPIRMPHVRRRLRILAEVLAETNLPPDVQAGWVAAEEALTPLVMAPGSVSCQPPP